MLAFFGQLNQNSYWYFDAEDCGNTLRVEIQVCRLNSILYN